MTTALSACRVELSKQIGDYWASASTSAGLAGGTTIVDSGLIPKENVWIGKDMYDLITESAHATEDEERKISSLSNTLGTLTVLAHSAQIGSGVDYEVHRLFTASEKRRALIAAARMAWPYIHEKIWDESMVSGNWLKDGSFEIWTSSSALTYWTKSLSTLTQTSTAGVFEHGAYSCKIDTAAGYIQQSITNWDDIKRLAGRSVTFTVRGWCDTASCLRISINDGVNDEQYSSYHDGDSAWTADSDPLSVTHSIDDNPTEITFKIYHALEAASETSYVDDARVISGSTNPRLFIENLGLSQERPVQVFIEPSNYSAYEPWTLIHNADVDTESGYLYLPNEVPNDYRLRIKGIGYLDFLDSAGDSATAWDSTININSPQTDILIAQAILYLYTQMSLPNFSRSTKQDFQGMIGFWERELRKRIGKHGMEVQSIPVRFR